MLNLEWVEILYGTHSNINEQLEERNIWLWATILRWTKTSLLPSLTVYNKSFLLSSAARNCMRCPHCFRVHNLIQMKVQNSTSYYLYPHFEKYVGTRYLPTENMFMKSKWEVGEFKYSIGNEIIKERFEEFFKTCF